MTIVNFKQAAAVAVVAIVSSAGPATAFPGPDGFRYEGSANSHASRHITDGGTQGDYTVRGHGHEHASVNANGPKTSDDSDRRTDHSESDEGTRYLGAHEPGPGSSEFILGYANHKYCCGDDSEGPILLAPGGVAEIPEPTTLALLGLALAGLGFGRLRRRI